MRSLWSRAVLLGAVAGGLVAATACARFEPEQLIPSRFQFEQGAHANVACASCHPDDPATAAIYTCAGTAPAWDGVGCLQCHECDRALHPSGANHFPGQDCVECHALSDPDWPSAGGGTGTGGGEPNCSGACHGAARADAAPLGDAHAAHLDASTLWVAPGACELCHGFGIADALGHPEHDNAIVTFNFTGISVADPKAPPAYTGGTCSDTYCHGSALPEGGAVPAWTGGAAAAECGTCHGDPPGGDHTPLTTCDACHLPTGGQNSTILDPSSHINGTIEAI